MSDDDELARRKSMSFEQAEGLAPLPRQLARTEISPELRAALWNIVYGSIRDSSDGGYINPPWDRVLKAVHVLIDHKPVDEFSNYAEVVIQSPKTVFMAGSYSKIYGWLQFVLARI